LAEGDVLRGRTRWLIVVVAIVAIVMLGRSQVGSRLLSLDPGREEPQAGQIEGKVWRMDPDAHTIEITTRVFGIGATSVVVTDDTLVIVGSKEGGFGDLREGLHVRAAWERRKDVRRARFVQVLDRPSSSDGVSAVAPAARRPDRLAPPAPSVEPPRIPTPVPPAAAPPALSSPPLPAEPRQAAPAPTVKAAPEPLRAAPGPTVKPAPEPRPAAAKLAPPPATRTPGSVAAPQPTTPPPTREPGPIAAPTREPDTRDPAAVIDWLLNQKD
jgi:hypothetical protein